MLKRNKPWIPGIVIHYQNLERCKEFLAACREIQATSSKPQAASCDNLSHLQKKKSR
jgi:hypothetical protein